MKRQYNSNSDDLEELLWRAEQVLEEPEEDIYDDGEDILFDDFEPEDFPAEEPEFFQNFANGYGAARPAPQPAPQPAPRHQPQPQYHNIQEDFMEPYEEPVVYREPRSAGKRKKRRRGCGCGCLTPLILLVLAVVAAVTLFIQPPKSDLSIGERKRDSASILICGTDEDGTRTDTMMLMYLSGSENQVRLLSLPRDTYTITSTGKAAKLNSAFGRNGTGEAGMEAVLDYVQDIIGYRPDGYILVDFTLVPQIVDIMGGVEFDVPMDMDVASVAIEEGYQHLSGRELMTLLRFRKGYATADLGRVEVQRQVLKACMEQWLSVSHITDAFEAISLLENGSISTLSTGNYIWIAKTLLGSLSNFGNDTLPGYADYRNDVSYYILNKAEVAALINSSYNPYEVTISPEDLNIAG